MKLIHYPLIVVDFDGTLVRSDQTIARETKEEIERYRQRGGNFAICTGRTVDSILPRAKELGLTGLVACFQGSVIVDIESGELLVDGALSQESAVEICRFLETLGAHINVYTTEAYYSNRDNELLVYYESIAGVKAVVIDDQPLSSLILERNLKVRKVLILVQPENKEETFRETLQRFGEKYYVTYSASFLVEITDRRYSKASAVKFMADYYGVSIEQAVAVGDSLNDLPMLECVGVGIAMQNADEALKQSAKIICPFTNDENAIGEIIKEYGYTKE